MNGRDKIDEKQLSEEIYDYVRKQRHVSFAEIHDLFPEHFKEGEFDMIFPGKYGNDYNIIIWHACSEMGINAIKRLLKENKIVLNHTSILTYLVDGCIPNLPVAQKPPKNGYKKPHWLPLIIDTFPTKRTILPKSRQIS